MNVGDAHHEPAFISSGDAHPAADALTDDTLALMSYNIGIQNTEIPQGRKLGNWGTKWQKLQDDVKSAFTHETGIQVLLLSEFGNMFDEISGPQDKDLMPYSTDQLLADLVHELDKANAS